LLACAFFGAAVAACAQPAPSAPAAGRSVGGSSPLVAQLHAVAADTGVPAELLAAVAWSETRLRGDAQAPAGDEAAARVGLLGIRASDLSRAAIAAGVSDDDARHDPEASMRAAAALLRTPGAATAADYDAALRAYGGPGLADQVARALARGLDARDASGASVVVPARPMPARPAETVAFVPASAQNYDTGSRGVGDIDHIVIHDTEGNFDGAVSWFQDPAAQVSAHYVVRSSDGHVVQMVHDKDVAWHDKCFNTHTIGVEHEGFMAHPDVWYTEAMYTSSATLVAALADTYGIAKEHGTILGHGEAPDCSDHTDPGPGWDWAHYIDLVKTGGAPQLAGDTAEVTGPGALVEGEVGDVMIQLANTGTAAWDVDATRLGTALPQDHDSVLAGADVAWPAPSRPTSVAAHTAPGETGAFAFQIQAPHVTHGTVIDEAFQLIEDDGTWFGPTMHVVVFVTPVRDAPQDPQAMSGCAAGAGSTNGGCAILVAAGVLGPALRRRRRRR